MWTTKRDKHSLLVIIPAYNEAECIVHAVKKLQAVVSFDYVIINDASTDETKKICEDHGFNLINHSKNKGLSGALRSGMIYAKKHGYKFVAQYDADCQHRPEDLLFLANYAITNDLDIVSGSRFLHESKKLRHQNVLKEIARKVFMHYFEKQTSKKITDPTNGLRVFSSKFYEAYLEYEKFEVEPSTIAYAIRVKKMTFAELPVVIENRIAGESTFKNFYSVIKYMGKQLRRLMFSTKRWRY
ncbi:glycosyltransferase family 2 protein [[Mycoplasma] testudinis]|uniref:glycosyltransferase family 2 protein n=1 Tax=[Mycoplasma] testudinis TaxID=33924 RepID=UPI0004849A37|nr:glycosyltransferase family 2 protein [[Mycoplasma] testudinis]